MKKLLSIACLLFILASCGKDDEWEANWEETLTGTVVVEEQINWESNLVEQEVEAENNEETSEGDEWENTEEEVVVEGSVEEEATDTTPGIEETESETSTPTETNASGEAEISWADQELVEEFNEELDELFELLKTDDQ